jgi:hypothetical protein
VSATIRAVPIPTSDAESRPNVRVRRFAVVKAGIIVAFLCGAACGPSVQSIYEGNVRFEHCYRLDLDLEIAPTHRQACWKEWLDTYTYGQPRDRIDYARRRLHAFAMGDQTRPVLDVGVEHKPETRQFYLVVPTPTSVHAPPPPIATRWYGDAGPPPAAPTSATAPTAPAPQKISTPAPGDTCAEACRTSFRGCSSACEGTAVQPAADCKKCDPDYKLCMKRCFQ